MAALYLRIPRVRHRCCSLVEDERDSGRREVGDALGGLNVEIHPVIHLPLVLDEIEGKFAELRLNSTQLRTAQGFGVDAVIGRMVVVEIAEVADIVTGFETKRVRIVQPSLWRGFVTDESSLFCDVAGFARAMQYEGDLLHGRCETRTLIVARHLRSRERRSGWHRARASRGLPTARSRALVSSEISRMPLGGVLLLRHLRTANLSRARRGAQT